MQKFIDLLFRCLIFLFAAVSIFSFMPATSTAQEITVGAGLLCDHPEELERYFALYHKGDSAKALIDRINHEAGQSACEMVTVAYVPGEKIKTIPIDNGFGAIVKVAIVGVYTGDQWLATQPIEQFMIVSVEDRGA